MRRKDFHKYHQPNCKFNSDAPKMHHASVMPHVGAG